jgi:hypothetical protein
MMAANLAPVYLDDARVTLQGDPRPQVSKILQAGGKATGDGTLVVRLREAAGADGQPLALDEVIDREEAVTPVYLRVVKTAHAGPVHPTTTPTRTNAPGDITRGTEAVSPTSSGEQAARAGRSESQRFAEAQSFADPAHRGGSPRVAPATRPSRETPPGHGGDLRSQQTGNEGGAKGKDAKPARPRNVTTNSRESLERSSEEE